MKLLKKLDDGIARGEVSLATLILTAMIVSASTAAFCRACSQMTIWFDGGWAEYIATWGAERLSGLAWVDELLKKGTLWLAFLGASLATREKRHIAIDILPRVAPRRMKLVMRSLTNFGSALVAFFLARAFWSAVLVNATERPAAYEVLGVHLCDADAQMLTDGGVTAPTAFCTLRQSLMGLGIPVETPAAAAQLIVPVMFFLVSVRLVANAVSSLMELGGKGSGETEGSDEGDRSSEDDTSEGTEVSESAERSEGTAQEAKV